MKDSVCRSHLGPIMPPERFSLIWSTSCLIWSRIASFKSIVRSLFLWDGVPPSWISEIRPARMITVAWGLGSGLTQSIKVQLVSINLKFFTPISKPHTGQDRNLLILDVDGQCGCNLPIACRPLARARIQMNLSR